jgi:hypothetical protein
VHHAISGWLHNHPAPTTAQNTRLCRISRLARSDAICPPAAGLFVRTIGECLAGLWPPGGWRRRGNLPGGEVAAGGRVPGIITADVAGRRTLDYAGGEGLCMTERKPRTADRDGAGPALRARGARGCRGA